jgi:hypothetical protein
MGAAATDLGVAPAVLKAAKKAGCIAFRAGRVNKEEIRAWLKLHPHGAPNHEVNGNGAGVDIRLKEAKAAREEIRLSRERGELLDRHAVEEAVKACSARLIAVLEREFGSELPPVLKGLDEVGIRQRVRERLGRIEAAFVQEIGMLTLS